MKITTETVAEAITQQLEFIASIEPIPDIGPLEEMVSILRKDQAFGNGLLLTFSDGSQFQVTVRLVKEAEV